MSIVALIEWSRKMSANPEDLPLLDPRVEIRGERVVIDKVIVLDQRFCPHSMRFTFLVNQLMRGRLDADSAKEKIYYWMQAERVLHPNMAPRVRNYGAAG